MADESRNRARASANPASAPAEHWVAVPARNHYFRRRCCALHLEASCSNAARVQHLVAAAVLVCASMLTSSTQPPASAPDLNATMKTRGGGHWLWLRRRRALRCEPPQRLHRAFGLATA